MKKLLRVVLLFGTMLGMLMLVGCGDTLEEDTYYVSMWDADGNNVFALLADGSFHSQASESGDKGTYEIDKKAGEVRLTSETGGEYTYILFGDYLLVEAYDGTIPDGDCFSAKVQCDLAGGGSAIMEFFEDGTMSRRIFIEGLMNNKISGTYSREGDLIVCDFQTLGTMSYPVKDGVIYDAYKKDPDFVPASDKKLTPTATPTATPTGTVTLTPTAEPTKATEE